MSKVAVFLTPAYEKRLSEIEDFIFESSNRNITFLEKFLTEHDRIIDFIKENPSTPPNHPQTGDQSWPFGEGRYRLFFKISRNKVYLLDLIDNRMSNLRIYPGNVLPTFDED